MTIDPGTPTPANRKFAVVCPDSKTHWMSYGHALAVQAALEESDCTYEHEVIERPPTLVDLLHTQPPDHFVTGSSST